MKIEREEFERERNYLNKTVSLIRKKISKLGQELFDDDSKVLEFKKLIWDTHTEMDPNEMRSMMAESDLQVSIMQSKGNYLQRLFRIQNKPYFGSIRFKEDGNEEEDNIVTDSKSSKTDDKNTKKLPKTGNENMNIILTLLLLTTFIGMEVNILKRK